MTAALRGLYKYLRDESSNSESGVRDTYGMWLEPDGSDEDSSDDEDFGVVKVDKDMLAKQQNVKKMKHAMRVGNPALMANEELQEELKKRGLSVRGDKVALAARLTASFEEEAAKMSATTRHVNHFSSAATQRNVEFLVSKVNKASHFKIQDKLKSAHGEIEKLEKLHDVITDQNVQLMEDERVISALKAQIAELEAKMNSMMAQLRQTPDVGGYAMGGSAMNGHTIGAFSASVRRSRSGGLAPWTLEQIAKERMSPLCTVLIVDTTSGKCTHHITGNSSCHLPDL